MNRGGDNEGLQPIQRLRRTTSRGQFFKWDKNKTEYFLVNFWLDVVYEQMKHLRICKVSSLLRFIIISNEGRVDSLHGSRIEFDHL